MKWTKLDRKNQPDGIVVWMRWKERVNKTKGLEIEYWAECLGFYEDEFFYPKGDKKNYTHVTYLIEKDAQWIDMKERIYSQLIWGT